MPDLTGDKKPDYAAGSAFVFVFGSIFVPSVSASFFFLSSLQPYLAGISSTSFPLLPPWNTWFRYTSAILLVLFLRILLLIPGIISQQTYVQKMLFVHFFEYLSAVVLCRQHGISQDNLPSQGL